MRRLVALSLPCLLTACLAVDDSEDVPTDEDGAGTLDMVQGDGKTDATTTELRTRIADLTVWVDPAIVPIARDGNGRRWRLDGRASRNLTSVFSFVPDDAYAEAVIDGKRTFHVLFDDAELSTMMSGLPVFIGITPATGLAATAGIWFAPRLGHFQGSPKIIADTAITPVWIKGDVDYRTRTHTATGIGSLAVTATPTGGPLVTAEDATTWRLDWTYPQLLGLLAPPQAPLQLTARRVAQTYVKTARLDGAVATLGLTRQDPYQVWVNDCTRATLGCLQALPANATDASACGSYRQVLACGGIPVRPE